MEVKLSCIPKWTVGVLFYGDYPELVQRCLGSLVPVLAALPFAWELRLATNEVSTASLQLIDALTAPLPTERLLKVNWGGPNRCKYPVLRELVHGSSEVPPAASDFFMWFDDDTFLTPGTNGPSWFAQVEAELLNGHMLGAPHNVTLAGRQHEWIKRQPWYAGRLIPHDKVVFATGGWWALRTELLRKYDWPTAKLNHRGGDVMLGALLHQQCLQLRYFTERLHINADASGVINSSKRRGHNESSIGVR